MQTDFHISNVARELSCSDGFLRRVEKMEKIPVARRNLKGWSIYN